ncbi:Ger(x)C family spore germination protein [Paenibacillus segetis]|uniref:Spore germination protein KC n=1 Tax=Paenibacillus segetis TaxID=1325360 RepID=A0ABQ1YQT1_9BACL|nr:Ger(x)C family spore germination protein [Paenibacillus segetis]GGH33293.1 hypothetical protein GCM10008013_38280 [Paenibacillus segetis]
MLQVKRVLLKLIVLLSLVTISGCWNYAEVDDLSIVAGVAIDKNPADGKLLLTVELVDTKSGPKQMQAGYKTISLAGDTMFDIVRKMISMTGKKLFWSHAKVIIISEEVARQEGVVRFIDWVTRDTETRADVFIFVSKEKTAREILNLKSTLDSITSFELAQMMRDEKYASSAPVVEIWDFINKLGTHGKSAIAPLVYIHHNDKDNNERVGGTAVFIKDRMVGTLSDEESKYMLFAKNDIKGGVLPVKDEAGKPIFSLEIISNETKIKPVLTKEGVQIQINTVTHTGLDEVMSSTGFTNFQSLKTIEQRAAEELEKNILAVIQNVQRKYHSDVFGFGEVVYERMPKAWRTMEKQWENEFSKLVVTVKSKVLIDSSGKTQRSIRVGD